MEIRHFETYNRIYVVVIYKNPKREMKIKRYSIKIEKDIEYIDFDKFNYRWAVF